MKKLTTIFLVVLQLLSHFHSAYAVTRLRNTVLSEVQAEAKAETETSMETETRDPLDIDNVLELGKACLGAFTEAVPDDVCYKNDRSWVPPTECPSIVVFSKVENDCVEACKEGYTFLKSTGKCYENCHSFEHDYGDKTRCEQNKLEGYGTTAKNSYSPRKLKDRTECFTDQKYELEGSKCYEVCKKDHERINGVCYRKCRTDGTEAENPSDKKTCKLLGTLSGIQQTIPKSSYPADSMSSSDDRMMCKDGRYKFAGRCYSDCAKAVCEGNDCRKVNCLGYGCSTSTEACYSAVTSTVLDVLVSSAQATFQIANLPLSFTVIAIKTAIQGLIDVTAILFKRVSKIVSEKIKTPEFVKKWKDTATGKVLGKVKGWVTSAAANVAESVGSKVKDAAGQSSIKVAASEGAQNAAIEGAVTTVCGEIYKILLYNGTNSTTPVTVPDTKEKAENALKVFDITTLSNDPTKKDECDGILTGTTEEKNKKRMECAMKWAERLKRYDPTGLVAVGAAFLKPMCVGI